MTNASQRKTYDTIDDYGESRYLTRADVGDGLLLTIKRRESENVARDNEEPRIRPILYFDETPKGFVVNRTNGRKIAKLLGSPRFDDWIGRQIVLYDDEDVEYAGKAVGGIRTRAAPAPKSTWKPAVDSASRFADDIPQ